MATVPPPVHHLPQNARRQPKRLVTSITLVMQSNVRILHRELRKGKSVNKACQVLTEEMFYILHPEYHIFGGKGNATILSCRKEVGDLARLQQCSLSCPYKSEVTCYGPLGKHESSYRLHSSFNRKSISLCKFI